MHIDPRFIILENNSLIDWLNFSVSLLIVLVAIFAATWNDVWKYKILKPKLLFKSVKPTPQIEYLEIEGEKTAVNACLKKEYTMYRILVINDGSSSAKNVRALVTSITQPLNMYWTHINTTTRDISKDEPAYLDIIKETEENAFFYPWGKIINLPEYELSKNEITKIKIEFFGKDSALGSVVAEFDPKNKTLNIL